MLLFWLLPMDWIRWKNFLKRISRSSRIRWACSSRQGWTFLKEILGKFISNMDIQVLGMALSIFGHWTIFQSFIGSYEMDPSYRNSTLLWFVFGSVDFRYSFINCTCIAHYFISMDMVQTSFWDAFVVSSSCRNLSYIFYSQPWSSLNYYLHIKLSKLLKF